MQWLDERGHRLPDRAQTTVSAARARPDLVYDLPTGLVGIFIDGPVHDTPTQSERDSDAEDRLVDQGWSVIRIRYDDDWTTAVSKFRSVFGDGRTT